MSFPGNRKQKTVKKYDKKTTGNAIPETEKRSLALSVKLLSYGSKVLFDKKVKFRALKPWEKGYIKEDIVKDGYKHIAIMEV